MRILKNNLFTTFTVLLVIGFVDASIAATVKLSRSGICHDSSSPYFSRTKNFQAFDTLEQCLNTGGRLPKGSSSSSSIQSASGSDYSRDKFGRGWADEDSDCQNTRAEILLSTSTSLVEYKDPRNCSVSRGRWISPFSNQVYFEASKLDIDHLVPLKWAWDHGASHWSQDKREAFANDPRNLLVVEASLNRQKGASGPDSWLPPANPCGYIARFERVRMIYALQLNQGETAKYAGLLSSCGK